MQIETNHPGDAEIDLWIFALTPAPDDEALLSADEMDRARRYVFDRDRRNFIAGRARLRHILGGYYGCAPASLVFRQGARGKPALDGPLFFNLSHSGGYAALGVARFEIGVDIELIRPISEDVAGRFFAPDEISTLRALPSAQQSEAFFACWTRKEAYLKALGDGLWLPLDGFSVTLAPGEPAGLLRAGHDPDEPARWRFDHFIPAPRLVGAVAARRQGWQIRARLF